MKKKAKYILMYLVILTFFSVMSYGKGSLRVTTEIIPEGTTKKYNQNGRLLLDAGVLNSNSDIHEIKIATIIVNMQTEQTNDGDNNPGGITGEFNLPFKLQDLESKLNDQSVILGELIKYKNGNNVKMELYTKNVKVLDKKVNNEDTTEKNYLFIAYPEEVPEIKNKVERLKYSFDLYLHVDGIEVGDIIRKDVETKSSGEAAVGRIKDIIKDQFTKLY